MISKHFVALGLTALVAAKIVDRICDGEEVNMDAKKLGLSGPGMLLAPYNVGC